MLGAIGKMEVILAMLNKGIAGVGVFIAERWIDSGVVVRLRS